ncbi:MAG TPA: biotin transporter BioY [Burkholderiales bacterium]
MRASITTYPTLLEALWPKAGGAAYVRNAALALVATLALAVSAKLQIPFWPVPLTMQTLVILLVGTAFGWKLGTATVLLYLAEGAIGLPVFAGTPARGIGLAYMAGPTGGYLVGFLAGAALCGWLAERGWDRSVWRIAVAMSLGHLLILALGWLWLAKLIGPQKAYAAGVAPFYVATVVKTALAVVLLPLVWRLAPARPTSNKAG